MRCYLSFSTQEFSYSQKISAITALNNKIFDKVIALTHEELKNYPLFLEKNRKHFENKRGYGYWVWKPFLILEVLKNLPINSKLMYCDSGVMISADPKPLFDICEQQHQVFFALTQHTNKGWVKRDLFVALNVDNKEYWDAYQITAQCHLWKNTPESLHKLQEWLDLAQDFHLISDEPSVEPNFPEFHEHRHDQSILSLLVRRWGNKVYRDPSQNGLAAQSWYPDSPYGQLTTSLGKIEEGKNVRSF